MSYIFGKSGTGRPIIIFVPVCFVILWIAHAALRNTRVSSYDQDIARHQERLFTYVYDNVDDLETNLSRIEDWLRKHNVPSAHGLQPGLSRKEIDQLLTPLSMEIPEELYTLYGWHNGQRGDQGEELIPAFRFLPLEEAIDTYRTLNKISFMYADTTRANQQKNAVDAAEHLPILMFNGDDFYVLLCGGLKSGNIISYLVESGDYPDSAYPNISSFVHELVERFQNKAYYIDEEGTFAIDSNAFLEIFNRHHPLLTSSEEYNTSVREERTQKEDGGEIVTSVLASGVTRISTFDAQERLLKKELYRNGRKFEDIADFHDEQGRIIRRISTYTDVIGKTYTTKSNWTYEKNGLIYITDEFGDGRIRNTKVSMTEDGEWCVIEKE